MYFDFKLDQNLSEKEILNKAKVYDQVCIYLTKRQQKNYFQTQVLE